MQQPSSTLIYHSPKFDSALTTRAALARLPDPPALGRLHKPVPHAVLVDAISQELHRRNYTSTREQLALSRTTATLFGVLDLQPTGPAALEAGARGIAFGFRK